MSLTNTDINNVYIRNVYYGSMKRLLVKWFRLLRVWNYNIYSIPKFVFQYIRQLFIHLIDYEI